MRKVYRSSLEYVISAFAGKYKTRIICSLMTHGPMRHKELRQLTDANDQALSLALKELLAYSIIDRHQYNEMPIKVVYSLTAKGKTIAPILHQVSLWALKHHEDDVTFEHDNSRLG